MTITRGNLESERFFWKEHAEASEARAAKVVGVLARLLEFADRTGQGCAKQVEDARTVLVRTHVRKTDDGN
jgi:hypothetical protein